MHLLTFASYYFQRLPRELMLVRYYISIMWVTLVRLYFEYSCNIGLLTYGRMFVNVLEAFQRMDIITIYCISVINLSEDGTFFKKALSTSLIFFAYLCLLAISSCDRIYNRATVSKAWWRACKWYSILLQQSQLSVVKVLVHPTIARCE